MRRFTPSILLATGLPCAVLAQGAPPVPTPTHDWGCEVLLCLANPNGAMAVAPCVPPIRKLWRELARGHGFPSCAMATGPGGRSYALPANSYYDRCPGGTTALATGQVAELAATMRSPAAPPTRSGTASTYAAASTGMRYTGIGHGDEVGDAGGDRPPPAKVCVAGGRGTREAWNEDGIGILVNLYDTIYVSPAQGTPRVIDVYVDDAYWQSVRW